MMIMMTIFFKYNLHYLKYIIPIEQQAFLYLQKPLDYWSIFSQSFKERVLHW